MEKIEQLMQLDAEKSEDVMLRDFVNKRGMLLNETLRTLARQCLKVCSKHEMPYSELETKAAAEQAEPRPLPKFTTNEEVCLAKCEAKMADIQGVIERHIDDSFNPQFVKKFI